jgi:hypothetical protein
LIASQKFFEHKHERTMAFTLAAFAYIIALIMAAFLIFFAIYTVGLVFVYLAKSVFFVQIIAIDELKTDYKNPIDQCNSLNNVCENAFAEN